MKIPTDRKMTFIEFVASEETLDGTIGEGWLKHWKEHIPKMLGNYEVHCGDCTNVACPCTLCVLETWLKDYKKYYFGVEEMEKENEIELDVKTLRELGLKHSEVIRKYQDSTKVCDEKYVSVDSLKKWIDTNRDKVYNDIAVEDLLKELDSKEE